MVFLVELRMPVSYEQAVRLHCFLLPFSILRCFCLFILCCVKPLFSLFSACHGLTCSHLFGNEAGLCLLYHDASFVFLTTVSFQMIFSELLFFNGLT